MIPKKVIAPSVLGLIVLLLFVLSFFSKALPAQCEPLFSVEKAKGLIDTLDGNSQTFSSSTKQLYNESSEGGIQTKYMDSGGKVRIIEQRLFGAIGRTFMRFYFDNNKLFALVKLDEQYKAPINVDPNVVVSKSTEDDYFFSSNGRVCTHILNGQSTPLGTTTQEMIESYVSQIQN
jgi:hypothetical protein